MRRFGGPNEGGYASPEIAIGKDSPDPNWAMPAFLQEAFRRRAMELVEEAEGIHTKPAKASLPYSIDDIFAKPEGTLEHVSTREGLLRDEFRCSMKPIEECSIDEIFAKPEEEYQKWKVERLNSDAEKICQTAVPTTGTVWRDGIGACVNMGTIAACMNVVAMIGEFAKRKVASWVN